MRSVIGVGLALAVVIGAGSVGLAGERTRLKPDPTYLPLPHPTYFTLQGGTAPQTPSDQTTAPQIPAAAPPTPAAVPQTSLDHLNEADRILSALPANSFKKDDQKILSELRKRFADLVASYRASRGTSVPPAVVSPADGKPAAGKAAMNWKEKFSEIEKDVASILGGVAPLSLPASDPRRQLNQFRLELELFFASATLGIVNEARTPQPPPNP